MMFKNVYFTGLLTLLFFLGAVTAIPVVAQDGNVYEEQALGAKSFDENRWAALHEELDYSGKPAKPKPPEAREPASPPDTDPSRDWSFDFPDLSGIVKILFALILLSLLAWLIYNFAIQSELRMDAPTGSIEDEEEVDLTNVNRLEEELDRRNVNPYLVKAEQQANYHLAVRLHFLALLKQLNEQGLIHWKKDRTNRFYLNEMRERPAYAEFRALTLTFERVWYGNYQPEAAEYQAIKDKFAAYRQLIQPLASA